MIRVYETIFLFQFWCVYLKLVDAACEYPSDLRGTWFSTSNGILYFGNDSIANLKNNADISVHTYTCEFVDSSRYISKASVDVFTNQKFNIYLCIRFMRISATKFSFTYETDILSSTGDRLVGIATDSGSSATVTSIQACNLTTSLPPGTEELLIKNDSVLTSAVTCPSDLGSIFDVTLAGSCDGNVLDGVTDHTKLIYNYSSCADTPLTFSAGGVFTCMYYTTFGDSTFLTVMNDDTIIDDVTYFRFVCYEHTVSNGILYTTYHPKICQWNQTSTYVTSPGVAAVMIDRYPINSAGGGLAVGAIIGVVFASAIAVSILLVLVLWKVRMRKKVRTSKGGTPGPDGSKVAWKEQYNDALDTTQSINGVPLNEGTGQQTRKKGKKKKRNKKTKLNHIQENSSNIDSKRRKSVHWEKAFYSSQIKDRHIIPAWQWKWENDKRFSSYSEGGSTSPENPNRTGSAYITRSVWMLPESEEQTEVSNVWIKVAKLWEVIQRRQK